MHCPMQGIAVLKIKETLSFHMKTHFKTPQLNDLER